MNEGKFLAFVLGLAITAGLLGPYGDRLLMGMAEAAITAQQHDQMSYGRFSHVLWAGKVSHPYKVVFAHFKQM